jgi:hypothetical protein
MTTTTVHGDRCGSTIEADRHLFLVEPGSLRNRRPEFDCCPLCVSALLDWLSAPASATMPREAVQASPRLPNGRPAPSPRPVPTSGRAARRLVAHHRADGSILEILHKESPDREDRERRSVEGVG